jgi:hypothetical protein
MVRRGLRAREKTTHQLEEKRKAKSRFDRKWRSFQQGFGWGGRRAFKCEEIDGETGREECRWRKRSMKRKKGKRKRKKRTFHWKAVTFPFDLPSPISGRRYALLSLNLRGKEGGGRWRIERLTGRGSPSSSLRHVADGRSYGVFLLVLTVVTLPRLEVVNRGKREVAEEGATVEEEGILEGVARAE